MAKYKDIAEDIRRKIINQEYVSGQKLPYEYVLCVSYHCNKETMKKALDILVKDGLIVRRRGAGTFVKNFDKVIKNTNLSVTTGLTAAYRGMKEVTSEIIEFEVIPADEFLSHKLKIDLGDFVYHIIRLRLLDKKPHMLDISFMPMSLVPNLKMTHLKGSIYEYIEKELKLKVQSSHVSIHAALSTPLEQQYLGLLENEPYIQEEHVSYLSTGSIFEYTMNRFHYKSYEFQTIILNQ